MSDSPRGDAKLTPGDLAEVWYTTSGEKALEHVVAGKFPNSPCELSNANDEKFQARAVTWLELRS
ncbi:hypothetical protein N7523_005354 [Penicillium sp. IBT 18751x]|nr:hypothetical protein N7523_005354 [Penicillium sp. IBT 18751x]